MAKKAIDKINEKKKEIEVHQTLPVEVKDLSINLNIAKRQNKYNPEEILIKAKDYITWLKDNPLIEEKAFGTGYIAQVKKLRIPTIQGFAVYLGITSTRYYQLEKEWEKDGETTSLNIFTHVRDMFYQYKIAAASAGLADSNIIARELGLSDKQEIKNDTQVTVNITLPDNGKGFKKELP
jgi:hypothetical protein